MKCAPSSSCDVDESVGETSSKTITIPIEQTARREAGSETEMDPARGLSKCHSAPLGKLRWKEDQ